MRPIAAAFAALLSLTPTIGRAAELPCLTPGEFTALADYALPSVITGTAQRCGTTLGPDAFLRRSGAQLAQRYAERRPVAWPGAKAAFLKLSAVANSDANSLIRSMPDASLQQALDALMAGMVAQRLPTDRCGAVDKLIDLLSPLPPASTAQVIALAVGLGAKGGQTRLGAITICGS